MNGNRSMVQEELKFRVWNARTMTGRERELAEKMKKYWLEMLHVRETKARGNGEKTIGDVSCVFSRVQAGRARAGVAVLLYERLVGAQKSGSMSMKGSEDKTECRRYVAHNDTSVCTNK